MHASEARDAKRHTHEALLYMSSLGSGIAVEGEEPQQQQAASRPDQVAAEPPIALQVTSQAQWCAQWIDMENQCKQILTISIN